ncbi:hypothetical protein BKG71_19330 [Mycobacteroides chelonae]|uniref:hypothetical protein n=1 Tax=Mycobacteroides chelonae TaxID=1774 RepID=UPI0008A99AE8|nr:hypothetical protein [Mycobacteroides chelonae]OHT98272.1 hypothetical protein BKG71_19330 [Mycobacteroides chelonae]
MTTSRERIEQAAKELGYQVQIRDTPWMGYLDVSGGQSVDITIRYTEDGYFDAMDGVVLEDLFIAYLQQHKETG